MVILDFLWMIHIFVERPFLIIRTASQHLQNWASEATILFCQLRFICGSQKALLALPPIIFLPFPNTSFISVSFYCL